MRRKLFIITITFIFVFSTFVSAATIKDISKDHWAYQSVKKLVDKGLLQLYEDDTFRGTDKVSRYQLAVIAARILEEIDSGTVNASAQDMKLLRKLSVEFQEELVSLAVQGDAFSKQIKAIEQKNVIQDEFMTEIKDVDISTLKTEIESQKERISNVESDVSQIIDSILKIKQIEEKLAVHGSLIEENQKQIKELKETSIQISDETMESLKSQISINDTRISSLQDEVNKLKSQLESKNNQINELELEKNNKQNYLYGIAGVGLLLLLLSN